MSSDEQPPTLLKPTVALIAHDNMKNTMIEFARQNKDTLLRCELCGTGTTSGRLREEVGLPVRAYRSGPKGGDLQVGARLAEGNVQALIFFRDPMTPQPHEPDINALVRACDVHNVPCATNPATGQCVINWVAATLDEKK